MSNNSDQPAYPIQPTFNQEGQAAEIRYDFEGLTKRELIAAMCLQGLMGILQKEDQYDKTVQVAIRFADSLLSQLEKNK